MTPAVSPPEALVDDRQPLLPEPAHCLVTAREIVVTGRVLLGKLARTAGSPRAQRLSKARWIWCCSSTWTVRYTRPPGRAARRRLASTPGQSSGGMCCIASMVKTASNRAAYDRSCSDVR